MNVGGVYTFLGSVSLQQKFEVMDTHSVTAQFYWQTKENTSLRHESGPTQKMQREESPRLKFGPSFYVFSPPPEPVLCKLV